MNDSPMVWSYIQSNFTMPNLIVTNVGRFDLTATFAHIEYGYGSRTECDEAEAKRRRAAKEQLKLLCVQYAYNGPDENDPEGNERALMWLRPHLPNGVTPSIDYTRFTPDNCMVVGGELVKQEEPKA